MFIHQTDLFIMFYIAVVFHSYNRHSGTFWMHQDKIATMTYKLDLIINKEKASKKCMKKEDHNFSKRKAEFILDGFLKGVQTDAFPDSSKLYRGMFRSIFKRQLLLYSRQTPKRYLTQKALGHKNKKGTHYNLYQHVH